MERTISILGYSLEDITDLASGGRLGSAHSKRVASGDCPLPKHSNQWRDFSFPLYYSDNLNPLEAKLVCTLGEETQVCDWDRLSKSRLIGQYCLQDKHNLKRLDEIGEHPREVAIIVKYVY
jgi:hypothetical protein